MFNYNLKKNEFFHFENIENNTYGLFSHRFNINSY